MSQRKKGMNESHPQYAVVRSLSTLALQLATTLASINLNHDRN
jgi:hypothetical protein